MKPDLTPASSLAAAGLFPVPARPGVGKANSRRRAAAWLAMATLSVALAGAGETRFLKGQWRFRLDAQKAESTRSGTPPP